MTIINDYVSRFGSPHKERLELVQSIITELAPNAKEALSYDMPAYKINGEYLIWFAAFKNHISIYPASDDMVNAIGKELAKRRSSTGTIQFKLSEPMPETLIRNIVRYRLQRVQV